VPPDLVWRHTGCSSYVQGSMCNHEKEGNKDMFGCMLYSMYDVLGGCCTRCMLYCVYAELRVCSTKCMLH